MDELKTQQIRLIDVFFIGPFMIWSARHLPPPANAIMIGLGWATILFNGSNYLTREGIEL